MATAEFSKFAGIWRATLSQHHLLGFEIAQLYVYAYYNSENTTLTPLSPGEDVEQQKLSFIAGWYAKWYIHFVRQFSSFSQN